MAEIDLGIYGSNSEKFKKSQKIVNSSRASDSLTRLVDQEIATFDGSQIDNFMSITTKYPNLSKDVVAGLVKAGASANTPGIDKIVSVDGINQVLRNATKLKELPTTITADKTLLGKLRDESYSVFKGATRVGFAALRSPYDYLTTTLRNATAVARGEQGAGLQFAQDLNPANLFYGRTTTFGALMRDVIGGKPGVDTGSGFTISMDSRVGKQQAAAMREFGRINGQSYTIGRGLASIAMDPNKAPYRLTSGIIDAVLNVATDPSTWLGFGGLTKLTGVTRGGKALAEAKGIAKAEKAAADLEEIRKLPSKAELNRRYKELKEEKLRVFDNHYMRADEKAIAAEDAYNKAVAFETMKRTEKISKAVTKDSDTLSDANIVNFLNENALAGRNDEIIDGLSQLSADFANTGKSFPGAFVVEELPQAGKITLAAQGTDEFAVTLAGKKKLNVLDLAQTYDNIPAKQLDLEIERRHRLFERLVEEISQGSLPAGSRRALQKVTNSDYIDDLLFAEGKGNLAALIAKVAETKDAQAVGILTSAIDDIWKVDAFANIRAIYGGTGGIAITNSDLLAAKGLDASETLFSAKTPGKIYDPAAAIKSAKRVMDKTKKEADAAFRKKLEIERKIKEVRAMRKAIADDPDLAYKIVNNPEYIDISDIAELNVKIARQDIYKEAIREEAGLIESFGGAMNLDLDKVNKFLLGSRFAVVANILAQETSPARIARLFKNKIDIEIAGQIADAQTSDDVLRILRNHLGNPETDPILARSAALRGQALVNSSPLFKTTLPVYHKAINVMERAERRFSRVYVRSVVAPLDDLDRLTTSVREWMQSAKVDNEVIDQTIDKLVRAKAGTDRNVLTVRSKIIEDSMVVAQQAMAKRIGASDPEVLKILQETMRVAGQDRALMRKYANALIEDGTLPGVIIQNGREVKMDGAVYVSQFLDTVVRLPDSAAIEKALAGYMKNKGVLGAVEAAKVLTNDLSEHWRTAMLVGRFAYILRNIGEMQIRQYLSGHETILSSPIGYMAMMIGNQNGNKMQKFLSHIEKYKNDALGNVFKDDDAEKLALGAVEEYRNMIGRHTSVGDTRSADAKVRLLGKVYKVITPDDENFHAALVTNIGRFGVDDMMQLVAQADTPAQQARIVDALINNKPLRINNEMRTNVLEDIYNASRLQRGERKVSNFDNIFLKNPEQGFVQGNLNEVGIRNWLFDPNSTASYQTALSNLMGNGPKGIYIRKLIADGSVVMPIDGKNVRITLPRYSDVDSAAEFTNVEKTFKKVMEKAFPAEDMPGATAIWADTAGWLDKGGSQYGKIVDAFFRTSAKLEDLVNFGPEYRMAFWDHIGRYAPALSYQDLVRLQKTAGKTLSPITVKGVAIGKKHQTLKVINKEIMKRQKGKTEFIPSMTLEQANSLAGNQASRYVRDIFYDATRQNMTANSWRLVFPFVQAHFNTIKTWAKLSAKNPVQVYKFGKAYDALTKPGSGTIYDLTNTTYNENEGFFYKDEFGTMRFRYPLVGNLFGAFAGLAASGNTASQALQLTAPVQSLNLALGSVNPGVPGFGPLAGIAYSATGRSQAFGPTWDLLRNFVFPFGQPQNAMDVALPAWLNKTILYAIGNSEIVERGVKNWAGYLASTGDYGDNPFADDATRNALMVDARQLSQFTGLFTALFQNIAPATPSQEVLARIPDNESKYKFMSLTQVFKAWQDISSSNPGDYDGAVKDFVDKFGLQNIMAIVSGSTRAVTGTQDAWSFLNNNPDMAKKYAVGQADIIPYFFPGGEAATSYYTWQVATGRREKLSPEELSAAAEDLVYNMELSKISEDMNTYNYNPVWYSEQVIALNKRYGGARPSSTVTTGRQQERAAAIGKALQEEAFKTSPVYEEVSEFYTAYNNAIQHLQDVRLTPEPDLGSSYWLNTKYRNELQTLGFQLMDRNPQFANMYYLVFANLLKENTK